MENCTESNALQTEQQVRELALSIMRACGAIHDSLRELSGTASKEDNTLPYALLTEEYALRSRANTLLIEAKRLARPGLAISQQEMLGILETLDRRIKAVSSLRELAELINSATLFANSVMSMKTNVISFLLSDLNQTINNQSV
ncbi:hypothetical protein ACEN9F_13255 [Duganella sp. CT11-25]|uniref:hypothetical protein n=1 Tax=unclassified Duganella TaxID=2636909 RepID=UPI0039AF1139